MDFQSLSPWLTSYNTIGFSAATIIFLVTLLFAGMRWIGAVTTFLLLLFALVAGFGIANYDLVREFLQTKMTTTRAATAIRSGHLQEQTLRAFDSLRAELEMQKHQIESLHKELEANLPHRIAIQSHPRDEKHI